MQPVAQVAPLVIGVMRARIFAQQVVHQPVTPGRTLQRPRRFVVLVIQQVAGRVEGEGLHPQAAGGLQQAANRIVLVGQMTTPGVRDVGQLPDGLLAATQPPSRSPPVGLLPPTDNAPRTA